MSPTLEYRKPPIRWMIIAGIAALCLHGIAWFATRVLAGDGAAAWGETQRQMALAIAWMVCALVLWMINPPVSRLHATLSVLLCALFVILLGSAAALVKIVYVEGAQLSSRLLSSFGLLGGILMLSQLALAVPSAIALQMVALVRRPVTPA